VAAERQQAVRSLLAQSANPDAVSRDGPTPLIRAAQAGHSTLVRLLLAHGAGTEVVSRDLGETALIAAARTFHPGVIRLLLNAGSDIDAWDRFGRTALRCAVDWANLDNFVLQLDPPRP
jgi:ankyrin repeat protein